jgi:hypothetical protein
MARPLKVNLDELVDAMTVDAQFGHAFLDKETGSIVVVGNDAIDAAEYDDEDADDELEDDSPAGGDDWETKERELARQIVGDQTGRYIEIERIESGESYRWMEDYIGTVSDARMRELLEVAIGGKGAFRRFKDTLGRDATLRERWFAFERTRQKEWATEWLRANVIEPV